MRIYHKSIKAGFLSFCSFLLFISCKKMVSISPPKNTISTSQVFATEAQAESAMAGIYTRMIHGDEEVAYDQAASNVWSAGSIRLFAGLSSGELYNSRGPLDLGYYVFSTNRLTPYNSSGSGLIWKTAYTTIYAANSVIEGIAASASAVLSETFRKELTGEAKFVRALAYFYLTNLYGDVPLALSVDFNQTANLPRAPRQQVYQQIIEDLKEAQANMRPDYSLAMNERVRPNKWAATALLARAYLYAGDYANAAAAATEVINNQSLYNLETDLNKTFLVNSKEAIWQLKQNTTNSYVQNATPEGYLTLPIPSYTGTTLFCLSEQLMTAFEPGDKRRIDWIDSTNNTSGGTPGFITFYPTKYKTGAANASPGPAEEYYMVLRLAEMYLIRAEAAAHGALGGPADAINDLNVIRNRAGLTNLAASLAKDQVLAAIEHERQVELFAEWGHRWLDLKRTGRAHNVLSNIPLKQPWQGDYQLLYPIPVDEIKNDHFLTQNPGYF